MSTRHQQIEDELTVTSALNRLLLERNVAQKKLAELAGVSEKTVSRIKNRRVSRIDCRAAARICAALSRIPHAGTGRVARVRLDTLFPMVSQTEL